MELRHLQSSPRLPLWIIEHLWTHRMMDFQQVVDPSSWPDVDSQPLDLDAPWRLRVASARAFWILKHRATPRYEDVMVFMDKMHRLLPGLVTPIKHMKIMFGLKTLVVMWMLREGRGLTDVIHKILQFFPNKLPQYEGQCSKREMFLMRKNQLDFKALAQTLTINKRKLQEYMKSQMEEEYGEHYAQKVEDRMVEYLHELDKALPTDTYIDKILKKDHPVNEEEKLLLDVVGSDYNTIGTTLKRLLHCDAASCCSHKPENEAESDLSIISDSLQPVENKLHLGSQPQVIREEQVQLLPKQSHLNSESRRNVQKQEHGRVLETEEDGRRSPTLGDDHYEEEGRRSDRGEDLEGTSPGQVDSPQFCSRHHRWVKNILRQCPDECSEELLVQSVMSSSPPLFQSSNSTSSSDDLTPSDLLLSPHRPPQTPNNPPTNTQDKPDCALALSSSSVHPPLPPLWSPVVRLVDIISVRRLHPILNPNPASPDEASPAGLNAVTSPHCQSNPIKSNQTASVCPFTGLSRRSRLMSNTNQTHRPRPSAETLGNVHTCVLATSASLDGFSTETPTSVEPHSTSLLTILPTSRSGLVFRSGPSGICRVQTRLSLQSQDYLVHSKLLQPQVILTRLSIDQCLRRTGGKTLTRPEETVEGDEDDGDDGGEDDEDDGGDDSDMLLFHPFDVNILYSSDSSGSDSEDSEGSDPEFRPRIKRSKGVFHINACQKEERGWTAASKKDQNEC